MFKIVTAGQVISVESSGPISEEAPQVPFVNKPASILPQKLSDEQKNKLFSEFDKAEKEEKEAKAKQTRLKALLTAAGVAVGAVGAIGATRYMDKKPPFNGVPGAPKGQGVIV